MRCDACKQQTGEQFQIRRHPENPTDCTNWHIHYCLRCAWLHDYRELAKIMTDDPNLHGSKERRPNLIIDLENVRAVEVYDDYTEPRLEQLKHVRFLHFDGTIIDVVAAKVDGVPSDVGELRAGLVDRV